MKFFDKPLSKYPLTSVLDYRLKAQKKLPKFLFEFLEGGAFEGKTCENNKNDFDHINLKRRVLKAVTKLDFKKSILGQNLDFPLILAPVGFAGIYAYQGEIQAARAASKAQIPFSLSTVSISSIEDVASQTTAPFWFQFYMFNDRNHSLEILQRAEKAKCPVLLITVDLPTVGARYRYNRTRKQSAIGNFVDNLIHPDWFINSRIRNAPLKIGNMPFTAPEIKGLSNMRHWMGQQLNRSFTWDDLDWVRSNWKGKIVIKGILDPEDAKIAKEYGADGIVVSNHGGRHIDGTLSTIKALPKICEAIKGDITVLVDGGITSGVDIAKALALGADACMIGKPWIYGLASRGEIGVSEVIEIFKNELKIVMMHLGISSVKGLSQDIVCD